MNEKLIVATLWELVSRFQSQKYIESVVKNDDDITFIYKDVNCNQLLTPYCN
jgi:hypothetical protein